MCVDPRRRCFESGFHVPLLSLSLSPLTCRTARTAATPRPRLAGAGARKRPCGVRVSLRGFVWPRAVAGGAGRALECGASFRLVWFLESEKKIKHNHRFARGVWGSAPARDHPHRTAPLRARTQPSRRAVCVSGAASKRERRPLFVPSRFQPAMPSGPPPRRGDDPHFGNLLDSLSPEITRSFSSRSASSSPPPGPRPMRPPPPPPTGGAPGPLGAARQVCVEDREGLCVEYI